MSPRLPRPSPAALRLAVALGVAAAATAFAPATAAESSDPRAVEIAEAVLERLGGRQAWDATRYVTWNFFGRRRHLWDKHTGDIRVEGRDRESDEPYLILMNLHDMRGRAWKAGVEVTEPKALAELLDLGQAAWINDSYWVFMPYKLLDPGVRLRHMGTASMLDGRSAEVLELTFSEVGRTPENKYLVYVAADTGLVEQWDFYRSAADAEPGFRVPWHDWRPHGAILLSADRGDNAHTDIAVLDDVPPGAFTSPESIDWPALTAPRQEPGAKPSR